MSAGLPRAARPLRRTNSLDVIAETALNGIVLRVAGELRSEALSEIRERISEAKRSSTRLSVDLSGVETIDREAILFFAIGEGRTIEIVCARHVQEWIRCEARLYGARAARHE
jgi:hypothetical protein